jgi:hypothetical protein
MHLMLIDWIFSKDFDFEQRIRKTVRVKGLRAYFFLRKIEFITFTYWEWKMNYTVIASVLIRYLIALGFWIA